MPVARPQSLQPQLLNSHPAQLPTPPPNFQELWLIESLTLALLGGVAGTGLQQGGGGSHSLRVWPGVGHGGAFQTPLEARLADVSWVSLSGC